ncbi:hypothetical protein FKP32DRAFT_1608522 [Trametes sanguinea]|nr:hypothetical protein FKP32DRAFT_1608522 [Trametes sanguinea]
MSSGSTTAFDLSVLTVTEIEGLLLGKLSIPRSARRPKAALIDFVLQNATEEISNLLRTAVQQKNVDREERIREKRRREADEAFQRRVAQRREVAEERETRHPEQYLALPSTDQVTQCFHEFYNATGNSKLATRVCGICARQLSVFADGMQEVGLAQLGNLERLRPAYPHGAQEIVEGCLLEPRGYRQQGATIQGSHKPDAESYQRAIRGTVCTYELSMDGVSAMVEGRLLPQMPSVLASVISVTFVGRGALPKHWLRTTFRVRRRNIEQALRWLKEHNPRYYGNITISEDRLQQLPEDDVPEELLTNVHQCNDEEVALQESAGYVPGDDDEDEEPVQDSVLPDVIPLQTTGTIDTDLSKLSASELMLYGLTNLWTSGREGGYAVRHGGEPASDFPARGSQAESGAEGRPANFFERAFPCLFPYGMGGFEGEQLYRVDLPEHTRWALRYHDRRFRVHETFPFKRQALSSARIQMRQKAFTQQAAVLSTINSDSLQRACEEEASSLPISDPAVRLLKQVVHGAAGWVQGSDASRQKIRAQIWSTCLVHGPPSLWITINPSDTHDPVAQVLAGANIDLDNFVASTGPSADERMHNIARDPLAAAEFFHFIINTVTETLYQVKVTPYAVKTGNGVLGEVSAYIGAVESQGRGTLHLHMLVWLKNTPSADEIPGLFQQDEFRDRVKTYIKANIRAYTTGLESAETTRAIPKEAEVAYNRAPNPDVEGHEEHLKTFELRLARMQQVHACRWRQCLFINKLGKLECKRRAPFEYAEEDYVLPDGRWGPKRLYRNVNAWNPAVLVNLRCNNDIKLLTNGGDTKNITFYVSSYASKKQGRNYNMSAVLAKGFAYDAEHQRPEYKEDLRERQCLLIFRLIHSINREQELAAPMVMSYLMGWNDIKTSHTYSPLYWSSFVGALMRAFPSLKNVS